jgi:hypothetical protein
MINTLLEKSYFWSNQFDTYKFITEQPEEVMPKLFIRSHEIYRRVSNEEGSGKGMLMSDHYHEFMETKWCIVLDQLKSEYNNTLANIVNDDGL